MSTPPGGTFGAPGAPAAVPTCYRHADRPTGLSCSRCGRPACPECLREASVGYQCLDCVAQGRRTVRAPRTIAGARADRQPVVLYVLIALNVLFYAITVIQTGSPNPNANSRVWQLLVEWPPAVYSGSWWTVVTGGFLHVSILHIALNMLSLWFVGRDLERVLGHLRFTAVYLVSLLGGGVAVLLFSDQNTPTAGASGAIFGLMGGVLVVLLRVKANVGQVIGIIAINLAFSVATPGISLAGHLGGLAVGALITAALLYAPDGPRKAYWQSGAVVVAVLVLVSVVWLKDAQNADVLCTYTPNLKCPHLPLTRGG
jgi:membrane associated rhomboid family serine protease